MLKAALLIRILITALWLACFSGYSQYAGKEVFKKFEQSGAVSLNSGSTLILFKDNSFVNYGILKDLGNQEVYVWYTFGTWKLNQEELVCESGTGIFTDETMISEIKAGYRKRLDYRLVDTYYEFVKERYNNYTFHLNENKATDITRNIEYIEMNEVSTKQ